MSLYELILRPDMYREFVKNLLWFQSSFGIRNPEQVAMVMICNLVAIQSCQAICNRIATLVATSVPERFRVVIRVAILKVLKFATLGVFYGCDWFRF